MDINPKAKNEGEHKLMHTWSVWDRYQINTFTNKKNYFEDRSVVYEFDTLEQFAALWNNTLYSSPSKFFFSPQSNKMRRILVDKEEKVLECIMLFKKGIEPKWEDPKNEDGGSLILLIDNLTLDSQIDEIWKNLVFALVGNTFPNTAHVNGIRFMDRFKKHGQLKLEVWINVGLMKYKKDEEVQKKH